MKYKIKHDSILSIGTSKIYDYSDRYVLRLTSIDSVLQNTHYDIEERSVPEFLENQIIISQKAFNKLGNFYGFNVPSYSLSVEKYRGKWYVVALQEKVSGETLFRLDLAKTIPFKEVMKLLKGYADYLKQITTKEPFWNDFKLQQFMYGTIAFDKEPKIYCIDIDPIAFDRPTKNRIDHATWLLERQINGCIRQYGNSVEQELKSLLSGLPKREPNFDHLEYIAKTNDH
jgi:hypothetical protein